ncbi:subtilisin family serine protease [Saccharothrix tamanrassetensis]|uniref:Subtilisin family serine protease n=1 Tax=Saccharothrix tamanrassetensis TaxID=1051531 RepID=A0A841CSQ5_9PSEU|nr:S8 family serine peptidase [Saccharothrix tamanrassetensis]MBB5960300.1 subtilisin family serine protease [Saccharothrix tamanrassetensis]
MINSGSRWRHRTSAALLAAVLGTTGFGFAAAPAVAQEAPNTPASADKGLDKQDRARLAEAEKAGQDNVTLLVAAEEGKLDSATDDLEALGGVVQSTERDVEYLKVSVPRGNAEKAAKLASVNAVDVDGLVALDNPRPEGATSPLPQPAPGANTPKKNPYMPIQDTKAAQFTDEHRKWDGRGTTIAILDSGIDLDHPALATTSTGERKIVDWYNANATNSGDGTWVQVAGRYNGTFTNGGATYKAPATGGPFSFGLFRETAGDLGLANSETGGDINRDGDKVDAFGVLQDITTKEVRVDVDGDGDFTDQTAMIDYKYKKDVGHFGADNPATPVLDTVAFVVQTDRSIYDNAGTAYVNIGISAAAHGTHVAGITAANKLFNGKMTGAAPGAKLMAVKVCLSTPSCTSSGLIDGVLYAARNGADVVNISIGGLPALNDGNNARAELYNRTIAEYNMQIFISAGNSGAGANTVGDPSVATDAVSVGSYITKETWLSNYGSVTAQREGLHGFSSRGPREDGGFKPNIVAPGSAISTVPQWQVPGPVAGTYDLPAGYAMFNGTSMAAPQATGAAALLVSAFKAEHNGERPTVQELRNAIQSGAKWVSSLQAYEQGAGLFDVKRSWEQLNAHPNTQAVGTSVTVNTALSPLLATPNTGVGIHDREGVTIGKEYTRTYTLTRTTGPARNQQFMVDWQGNDGTFSSKSLVSLPLNTPVKFDVKVKPTKAGAHSAVLKLDNPATRGIDVFTLNTVFAAEEFTAANKHAVTKTGAIPRNQSHNYFVRVPAGTSALKVDLAGGGDAGKGQVRFLRYDPYGVPADTTSSTNCYNPDAGAGCAGGSPTSRTVSNPVPGVWEIVVEARRTSDVDAAPYTVTASVLGTSVSPDPDTIASAQAGVGQNRTYTVKNSLAAFNGRLVGGALSSAKVARPAITEGVSQTYDVTVPAGTTSLRATIGRPSDISADLDLLVYNCTSGTCVLFGQTADGDSEESFTVNNPAAGAWRVQVDGYAVPSGSTEYDYIDVYAVAGLGTVAVTDTDADRVAGATWTVPGVVTATGQAGAGRVLRGELTVQTSEGAVVGRSAVVVQNVV